MVPPIKSLWGFSIRFWIIAGKRLCGKHKYTITRFVQQHNQSWTTLMIFEEYMPLAPPPPPPKKKFRLQTNYIRVTWLVAYRRRKAAASDPKFLNEFILLVIWQKKKKNNNNNNNNNNRRNNRYQKMLNIGSDYIIWSHKIECTIKCTISRSPAWRL